MDFIPGPRRALVPHVAVPFLADVSRFPDPDSWRQSLPQRVKGAYDVGSGSKETAHEALIESSGGPGINNLDLHVRPISKDPLYFDIYPQLDEQEKGSFQNQELLSLKSRGATLESIAKIAREVTGSSAETPVKYFEYLDHCALSDTAKRNRNTPLPAATEPYAPGQTYDGKGFRSFPERRGLDSWCLDYEWESDEFLAFFHQMSPEETAIFLQSWLYFGLLSEVFGKHVREKDFVTSIDPQHEIITLQKFLTTNQWKSWGTEIISLAVEDQVRRAANITYALTMASKVTRLEDAGRLSHIPFSAEIALSIRMLGAVFSDVCLKSSIASVFDIDQRFQTCQQWGFGKIMTERFASDFATFRWCPNDLARMKLHLPITALYFLTSFRSGAETAGINIRGYHDKCSDAHCFADSIDEANYETEHSALCDGKCRVIEPDMEKVKRILADGGIPIFRFKKSRPQDGMFTDLTNNADQMTFEHIFHRSGVLAWYSNFDKMFKSLEGEDPATSRNRYSIHDNPTWDGRFGVYYDQLRPEMLWEEPLEIEVLRYDGNMNYVAISHVWADGLGNVKGNGLPACRLPFLRRMLWQTNCPIRLHPGQPVEKGSLGWQGLIRETDGLLGYFALTQLPIPAFWIDTFGIPRSHGPTKRAAIKRMSDTYSSASKVIVLDGRLVGGAVGGQALGNHCEHRPMDEMLGLLLTSPWMRRLWTLQEALLAKKILLMFSEGPLDLSNLLQGVADLRSGSNDSPGALVREQLAENIARIISFKESLPSRRKIQTVWNASVGRTATKPGDISLCLATALGMDPALLSDVSEGERSRLFYTLLPADAGTLPAIDSSIIFSSQEKLTDYGFRWADRQLCARSLGSSRAATIVSSPQYGLRTNLHAARTTLPAQALNESTLRLWSPEQGRIFEITAEQRFEGGTWLPTPMECFIIMEDVVDWGRTGSTSAVRKKGLLASLDVSSPTSPAMVDGVEHYDVCIERLVSVSLAGEHDPSAQHGLDDGHAAPNLELGAFDRLYFTLR